MPEYYKPKQEKRLSEEHKAVRTKLFFDKRVKQITNCIKCDMPITLAEFKRNKGLCESCNIKTD